MCSSKSYDYSEAAKESVKPFYQPKRRLYVIGGKVLDSGVSEALAVVSLTDCRPMTKEDEAKAWVPYQKERWAWAFQNVQPLKPFPVKGRLGLWNYNGDSKTCKHYFGSDRCDIEPSCDWYPAKSLFEDSK